MSTKTRLITAIVAFCLVLSFLVVGVWAAMMTYSFGFGGEVSFTAKNVYCQVTGSYTNTTPSKSHSRLKWDVNTTEEPSQSSLSSWKENVIQFDKKVNDITFTITIENLSEEVGMTVSLQTTQDDKIDSSDVYQRTIAYVDSTGASANYVYGTAKPVGKGETVSFTITYTIDEEDQDFSAEPLKYAYNISLVSENA